MADDTLRVTLRLKTIDHLFEDPGLSPFDPYYAPYSFAAGLDYLVGEMERTPRLKRTALTVLLPPDAIEPGLETRTREAIDRYSDAWTSAARQTGEVESRKARFVGPVAILFFAIANILYILHTRAQADYGELSLVLDVLMEGVSVGAWVALWWPLDLLYQRWQRRLDVRTYSALRDVDLHILPDPHPPDAAAPLPSTPRPVSVISRLLDPPRG